MPTRFNFFCEIRKYLWSDSFSWQYSGTNEWPEHNPTPQSRNPRPLRLGDSSWLWNLKPYWCESPEGHGTALTSVQCLPFSSARMTLRKSCSHHKFSNFFFYSNPMLKKASLSKWGYSLDLKIGVSLLLELRLLSCGRDLNRQDGPVTPAVTNSLAKHLSPRRPFSALVVTFHNSDPSCSFHKEVVLLYFMKNKGF